MTSSSSDNSTGERADQQNHEHSVDQKTLEQSGFSPLPQSTSSGLDVANNGRTIDTVPSPVNGSSAPSASGEVACMHYSVGSKRRAESDLQGQTFSSSAGMACYPERNSRTRIDSPLVMGNISPRASTSPSLTPQTSTGGVLDSSAPSILVSSLTTGPASLHSHQDDMALADLENHSARIDILLANLQNQVIRYISPSISQSVTPQTSTGGVLYSSALSIQDSSLSTGTASLRSLLEHMALATLENIHLTIIENQLANLGNQVTGNISLITSHSQTPQTSTGGVLNSSLPSILDSSLTEGTASLPSRLDDMALADLENCLANIHNKLLNLANQFANIENRVVGNISPSPSQSVTPQTSTGGVQDDSSAPSILDSSLTTGTTSLRSHLDDMALEKLENHLSNIHIQLLRLESQILRMQLRICKVKSILIKRFNNCLTILSNHYEAEVEAIAESEAEESGSRVNDETKGLDKEEITKYMRRGIYVPPDSQDASKLRLCCICQEEFVHQEELGKLKCGHNFHTMCVTNWLMERNLCPICKAIGLEEAVKKP